LIHSGNPREGPGDRESMDWALNCALSQVDLPEAPRVLDAGCGPGADIPGLLAHMPRARLIAMDSHAPYIERVRAEFVDDPRVKGVTGDMAQPEGRFDLIWSAGALYNLGVGKGLRDWHAHLVDGGAVVFSELAWTCAARSAAATDHWAAVYPAMQDREGVLAEARAAGYEIRADRFLPRAAWANYYDPLQARVDELRAADAGPGMQAALDEEQREIDLWRGHGDEYGYLQVVAIRA